MHVNSICTRGGGREMWQMQGTCARLLEACLEGWFWRADIFLEDRLGFLRNRSWCRVWGSAELKKKKKTCGKCLWTEIYNLNTVSGWKAEIITGCSVLSASSGPFYLSARLTSFKFAKLVLKGVCCAWGSCRICLTCVMPLGLSWDLLTSSLGGWLL